MQTNIVLPIDSPDTKIFVDFELNIPTKFKSFA